MQAKPPSQSQSQLQQPVQPAPTAPSLDPPSSQVPATTVASNSASYQIVHETVYRYSESVPFCQNQLRMRPREQPNLTCSSCVVEIEPKPSFVDIHPDYFGNVVDAFAIEALHQSLRVRVTSQVQVRSVHADEMVGAPTCSELIALVNHPMTDEAWKAKEFTYASNRIQRSPKFAEYAQAVYSADKSLIEVVAALTKKIHHEFKYDTTATHVDTSTAEAFDLKAGVCQDFAHVQLACLRSLGIPARYVSGYLRTHPAPGKERLVGCDESHGWIGVWAGPRLGWVGFDPTNDCLTNTDHIPVCVGRDYEDVSPMRGIVLGGGTTTLSVSVDVLEVDPSIN